MLRFHLRRRMQVAVLFAVCVGAGPTWVQAQSASDEASVMPMAQAVGQSNGHRLAVTVLKNGDSSRRQRSAAVDAIPWNQLTSTGQQMARKVIKDVSLYRRMPEVQLISDRRTYEFFTANPDVAVSIWRALDISQVQMWQTGPNEYETDTRDGTRGVVTVLLRSPDHYVIHCSGQFQSPVVSKPLRAEAIMHLQPHFHANGTVSHELDLFVCLPSQTLETVAKLVSPVSNRIADKNFEEVSLFVEMMNTAMSRQPGWVEQLTARMDGVLPERPQQLLAVTAQVYVDAEKRRLAAAGIPASVESIRPPVQQAVVIPPAPGPR